MRVCSGLETCAPGADRGSRHGEATSGRHLPPPAPFSAASHHPCQACCSSHISLFAIQKHTRWFGSRVCRWAACAAEFWACTSGSALCLNLQKHVLTCGQCSAPCLQGVHGLCTRMWQLENTVISHFHKKTSLAAEAEQMRAPWCTFRRAQRTT